MLESLKVKNVALIDESDVEFGKNLNILTGETGAGKSILIGSINLALGAKADKGLIRHGAEYAYVELCFLVESKSVRQKLKDLEIFPDEENRVVLQRRIMPGKSTCRMNGENVSGKILKEAASILIDIHGQQEHQSLLNEKKHLEILDNFCGEELVTVKEELIKCYHEYCTLLKKVEEAKQEDGNKEREIALAQFELDEINKADLQDGEDEVLENDFRRMENIKTIGDSVANALSCICGYENENVQSLLDVSLKSLHEAVVYDEKLSQQEDVLIQVQELLRDSGRQLEHYLDGLELDGEVYRYTSERLDLINKLKSKYGYTINDILSYAKDREKFLHKFEDFEEYKEQIQNDLALSEKKLKKLCQEASNLRVKEAQKLQAKMKQALLELNFTHVDFKIEVIEEQKYLSHDGDNYVRFLISLNAGEKLKPLINVASGGELSRIMLALKSVMAEQDEIETLIFDEIDTGISGRTAWKVSEKLAVLGRHHQVICITHLPQIAAMADQHFVIEKSQTEKETKTTLTVLNEDGMINEIARLLGSDTLTSAVIQNAIELKDMARHTKQY